MNDFAPGFALRKGLFFTWSVHLSYIVSKCDNVAEYTVFNARQNHHKIKFSCKKNVVEIAALFNRVLKWL